MGKWKMAAKPIVFLLLFISLGFGFTRLLTPFWSETSNQSETFYNLAEDEIDVMVVGSSSLRAGVSPLAMWEARGITAFSRSSSVQAPLITYFNVAEGLEYQTPEVVIIGTMYLFDEYDVDNEEREPGLRATLDTRRLSKQKLEAIRAIVQESEFQTFGDYLFPIVRHHAQWASISETTFQREHHYTRGHNTVYRLAAVEDQRNMTPVDQPKAVNEDSAYYYRKAIEACLEKGCDVLLLTAPRANWTYDQYLAIQQLADEYGVDYLDFNLDEVWDAAGIDVQADFYDGKHLNTYGAVKISQYLADYLAERYQIPDRRTDETVAASYNADYERFRTEMEERRTKLFPEEY